MEADTSKGILPEWPHPAQPIIAHLHYGVPRASILGREKRKPLEAPPSDYRILGDVLRKERLRSLILMPAVKKLKGNGRCEN